MKDSTLQATKTTKLRVLIIEDEPNMIDFLTLGLEYEGFAVQSAGDGIGGLRSASENPPDLVILDVMLPGMDGFEVCQRLRHTRNVPIIMLTARDAVDDRVSGLDVGADDYVTKPFQFKELAARVRAVLRRKAATTDDTSNPIEQTLIVSDIHLDPRTREVRRGERVIDLSQREVDLLTLLMRHPNQVMTREVILDQVWGYDFGGDYNIIEVYIRYLRQKLGEPNLIFTVRGVGYVLRSATAKGRHIL